MRARTGTVFCLWQLKQARQLKAAIGGARFYSAQTACLFKNYTEETKWCLHFFYNIPKILCISFIVNLATMIVLFQQMLFRNLFTTHGGAQEILDQVAVSGLPEIYAPPIPCNFLFHVWSRGICHYEWGHHTCMKPLNVNISLDQKCPPHHYWFSLKLPSHWMKYT